MRIKQSCVGVGTANVDSDTIHDRDCRIMDNGGGAEQKGKLHKEEHIACPP